MDKLWHDVMGSYIAMKMNELLLHLATWINQLQEYILSSVLGRLGVKRKIGVSPSS